MISLLLHLVIVLIVLGLLWWAVTRILAVMPIAEPFKTVIYVILVLVACFVVLYMLVPLFGSVSLPSGHLLR